MSWDSAIKVVGPHVVRIETPNGSGTGFLAFYNHDRTWCGIATAAHVVSHADEWQEPIRITNAASVRFLKAEDRVIFLDRSSDSATVLFFKGELHGVSGGPVFHCPDPEQPQIIGSVSAYHANRATGEALPGLLRAQDVSHFHAAATHIRNIDEANAKKKEFEEAQKAKAEPRPDAAAPSLEVPATPPRVEDQLSA
jgi:hypothetical protein